MKSTLYPYLFLLFCLVFISRVAFGQSRTSDSVDSTAVNPIKTQPRGLNTLSCSSYQNISYKGYTIQQINNNGENFEQLWGLPTHVEKKGGSREKLFRWGENELWYNYELKKVSVITIKNSKWSVQVEGKAVNVNDTFSEVQTKLGQNIKIRYLPEYKPGYFIAFGCPGSDYDGLLIYFDSNSDEVTEISYFVNP